MEKFKALGKDQKALLLAAGVLLLLFIISGTALVLRSSGREAETAPKAAYRREWRKQSLPKRNLTPTEARYSDKKIYFSEYDGKGDRIKIYKGDYREGNSSAGSRQIGEIADSNIKALQRISGDTFIYIGGLDGMGRGDGVYAVNSKFQIPNSKLISAPEGFVFDQMYLSPNKREIVVWEIGDGFYLKKSISRIVLYKQTVANVKQKAAESKWERRVLIEEGPSASSGFLRRVYYPVFWGPDGSIYLDTLDAMGGGLYHGLFVIRDIGHIGRIGEIRVEKVLGDGKYSTIPVLSPDGKKLAYTASNSSRIIIGGRAYSPIKGARYYNLVWGPESKRIAAKAVGGKKDRLVAFEVLGGGILESIDSFAGVFAWEEPNIIALSARVGGFGGLGGAFVQPGGLPSQGVYLYNLADKSYRKVYSDNIISIIR